MKLELHPLCTFFPRMEGAEFEELKEDIRVHGLRQRIIVHKGMILDGGNRYRACLEVGVNPTTMDYNGSDPVAFVMSQNMHRRHLSVGQKAVIVAAAADWAKAQTHGGNRQRIHSRAPAGQEATIASCSPQEAAVTPLQTIADRAEQSGASERTQKDADKVVRENPKLAQKVAQGKVTLPQAVKQVRKPKPKPAEPEPIDGMPDAAELLDQINAENKLLQERIDALTVTDQAKKIDELVRLNDHYRREKDAEMDKNARLHKERDALARFQAQVVEASGANSPKAALAWIKSMQRVAA